MLFVYFMGYANRGPGGPASVRPSLLVENRDQGWMGASFLDALGAQGLNLITNASDAARGVRIPTNFTQTILSGEQGKIEFFTVQGSGDASAALVQLRVVRALVALNSDFIELPDGRAEPTLLKSLQARPPLVALTSTHAGRKPMPTGFNLSLPGVLVMYVMMNLLIFGGTAVSAYRKNGVLRRMEVHPISRGTLIAGKIYGLILLGGAQVAVLLLAGRFLFHVPLGDQLPALLLVMLVYSWVAASLGVLVGSVLRAEDKVIGLCVLLSMVMAALGGCWWPLEVVPGFARTLAHCIPSGWAMDALNQLITFGNGISSIWLSLGMLGAFGLCFNAAAARLFRT